MRENSDKLLTLIAEVLKVDKNEINADTSPKNTKNWDSFNTLKMIIAIENEFNIKLPLEEVVVIKSVKDIKALLMTKGVALNN